MTRYEIPDSPGEWWFGGTVTVPHSTTPGHATTIHLATPRQVLIVKTQFGLTPADPSGFHSYALYKWDGWWEKGLAPR